MPLFKKHDTTQAETVADAPVQVTAPSSGTISLKKGQGVSLTKTGSAIVASNGWTARGKDYDLKALVLYKDGHQVYVGAANVDELLSTPEGAVRHSGDVRAPGDLEKITISWHPDIAAVALSSYSALENGPGSFKKYGVYVNIQNGQQTIGIAAADTNANPSSYTCYFGEVIFEPGGSFTVVNHEEYSRSGSERRIAYKGTKVVMDAGPEGQTK